MLGTITYALLVVAVAQDPVGASVTRDSAGVTIIEHATLRSARSAVRIDPRPILSLGGLHDDENMELDARQPFLSITKLGDGTLVVPEMTQIKFFAADGRFLRKVGRAGRGPGEYLQIREVCLLRGDSLLVIDFSIGTLTLLDRAGAQVRSFARPGYVPINGCRADGTVIVQRTPAESVVGSSGPVRLDYALIRPDGSELSSLGAFERGSFAGPISFEPSVVPMGDGFLFADPRRGELQVRSATGRAQRIIRTRERRAGPSEAEWEQRVLGMLPRGASEEQRKTLMTRIMPLRPASMPLFGRVRVDAAGRIWIQDAEARRMYMVLSPTGALLGQVEIPDGDLANFLPDQVVILYRDEDGTPYLRIHPLSVTR